MDFKMLKRYENADMKARKLQRLQLMHYPEVEISALKPEWMITLQAKPRRKIWPRMLARYG
jgi:hypothetical protein